MSRTEILIALGLLVLVCVLVGFGPTWHAGLADVSGSSAGAAGANPLRFPLFVLGSGAATLAVLLAEDARRREEQQHQKR